MKDLLILYPHGLGDCILLTPAIREFYKKTGNKVNIATLERFKTAKFFDNNPYVDKIFYTKDAWHDYSSSHIGFQQLKNEWKNKAKQLNFDGFVMPMHSTPKSKIMINLYTLGLKKVDNYKTEIHTTKEDKERAKEIISKLVGTSDFGFIQTSTGVPSKDLPKNYGRHYMYNNNIKKVIELGEELDPFSENINVQFEIMRQAKKVCIPDSVFYHACHAMEKEVDYVYFARGEGIYQRVRPLHKVKENVVYKLKGAF